MLHINYVDAEIIKDGTSHLVSKNDITGTSLEVLSFMVSGIEQSHHFNDGIDGRSRLFDGSEDKYRTVNLTVRMDAEYMQRVAHVRDSINQLFSGEFLIREMRIKQAEVAYESIGGSSGDMNLGTAEYVNGKQLKVTKVSPIEIADDRLSTDFTVELETTDLPYFESIYTTKELHDTGYDAAVAKYGLVDGINHDQVQYVFPPASETTDLKNRPFEQGLISSSTGEDAPAERYIRSGFISVLPGQTYEFKDKGNNLAIDYWWVYEYDEDNNFIGYVNSQKNNDKKTLPFKSRGYFIRLLANPHELETILSSEVGYSILPQLHGRTSKNTFTVYNAGNVTVEPESMLLEISLDYATTSKVMQIKNKTTGEIFEYKNLQEGVHIKVHGMTIKRGLYNALRLTNRKFLSLKPGNNEIEITGATFEEFSVNTKFYYK